MKDITKNEIANIIHVLAYLAKIDNVVDPAEKKTFKIVCERSVSYTHLRAHET